MYRCLSLFHFVVPLVSTSVVEDDSVNLLQTTVHKHLTSGHVAETKKTCVVKGDPHVKMWSQTDADGARLGLYGTYADYWLVNTDQLKVMGRIGGVSYAGDMGVVKGTAISGSLIANKVLIIPPTNNGDITLDGVTISLPFVSTEFNMTVGVTKNFQTFPVMKDRENSFTITMGTKAEILINQDVFQHLQIMVDESIVADDKGLCKVMCRDWFRCQDPICDLKDSLFVTKHDQCGEEISRVKCNKLRLKLATEDCKKLFADIGPDEKAGKVGMGIQNCIEDCCSARDQCPDRNVDGTATCLIFGDPHIKGFDTPKPDTATFSPTGTHYLVKSDFLSIQANYISDKLIKAQIEGIAFTGALVSDAGTDGKHRVIYFRPASLGSGVFLDGVHQMSCKQVEGCADPNGLFYDDPKGHFNITYGSGDDIPELLQDKRPVPQRKNVYTLTFFQGAKFLIHEGTGQSIYMGIGTRLLSGVTGECGNFNGIASDDGHASVMTANANCVSQADIFIPDGFECLAVEIPTGCKKKKVLTPFRKQCKRHFNLTGSNKDMTGTERSMLKDCMQDCCLGGTCPDKQADASDEAY